jgi:hypothetical protein
VYPLLLHIVQRVYLCSFLFVLSKSQKPGEMNEHKQQLEEHQDIEDELSASLKVFVVGYKDKDGIIAAVIEYHAHVLRPFRVVASDKR